MPGIMVGNAVVIIKGKLLKIAEIFDAYWIEKNSLPDPIDVIREIRNSTQAVDLFTFEQRIPDIEPHFDYPMILDNKAVIQIDSYEDWFHNKISSSARRNIRSSVKRGVVVKVSPFNDEYIHGIMAIYNESPIRQGRMFWHYSKEFDTVRDENGTYAERSTFLAAIYKEEMIGYCKIVWDEDSAAIMQIISRMEHYDKRPNNALLAEAVRQCCKRKIPYLIYERYEYGKKAKSSLTDYKRNNGFIKMEIPKYFIPLTLKGKIALKLGFYRNIKERIPEWLIVPLIGLRAKWYHSRYSK